MALGSCHQGSTLNCSLLVLQLKLPQTPKSLTPRPCPISCQGFVENSEIPGCTF